MLQCALYQQNCRFIKKKNLFFYKGGQLLDFSNGEKQKLVDMVMCNGRFAFTLHNSQLLWTNISLNKTEKVVTMPTQMPCVCSKTDLSVFMLFWYWSMDGKHFEKNACLTEKALTGKCCLQNYLPYLSLSSLNFNFFIKL